MDLGVNDDGIFWDEGEDPQRDEGGPNHWLERYGPFEETREGTEEE